MLPSRNSKLLSPKASDEDHFHLKYLGQQVMAHKRSVREPCRMNWWAPCVLRPLNLIIIISESVQRNKDKETTMK
jgi:hypothetical protein